MFTLQLKKLFALIAKGRRRSSAPSPSPTDSKMFYNNLLSSSRLAYRALEDTKDDILKHPPSCARYHDKMMPPPASECFKITTEWTKELLSVSICLPSECEIPAHSANPVRIGYLRLSAHYSTRHNRSGTLAITIFEPYQGKGYGTEAIDWALDWAFKIEGIPVV